MVVCEDLVRSASAETPRNAVNWPAFAAVFLAAAALPILLMLIRMNPPTGYSPGSFGRIRPLANFEVTGVYSLLRYASENFGLFLASAHVAGWWRLALPASLGLAILRPHFLLLGVGLVGISWLMQDDPLWPPRYYGTYSFFQVLQLFAFSSAWAVVRWAAGRGFPGRCAASAVLLAIGLGIFTGFRAQLSAAQDAVQVYTLRPALHYGAADRARADALYSVYRHEGIADEPVIASPFLFRYAHDRNLFWYDRLEGRPKPVWILWDGSYQGDLTDYELKGQNGRFSLYRRK
jgi:hypothetical protein